MVPILREREAVNTHTLIVSFQAALSSSIPVSLSATEPPVPGLPHAKDAGCSTTPWYFYLGEKKLLIYNGECLCSIHHCDVLKDLELWNYVKLSPNFHVSVLLFSATHLFPY